jgi:hypothetical protein
MASPLKVERRQRSDALMATPEETFDSIIDMIVSGGGGLYAWCGKHDVPYTRFKDWIDNDPERRRRYEQALVASADAHVAVAQALMAQEPKVLENGAVDNGWVNWRKTQAGFHQWLSARLMPRRYGDSLAIEQTHTVDPKIIQMLLEKREEQLTRVFEHEVHQVPAVPGLPALPDWLETTPTTTVNTRVRDNDLPQPKEQQP